MKVLTFNINKSRGFSFLNDSTQKIKDLICELGADVVMLQEVVGANKKRGITSPQFEELADSIWSDFAYAKNAAYKNGHHGNVILSKYPITKWENLDLTTNRFEFRGMLFAEIEVGEKKVHLYCTHLDLLERGRLLQVEKIIRFIHKTSISTPFILCGDFNDWSLKNGQRLERELQVSEAFKVQNGSYTKSFPSFSPFLKLDRIYYKSIALSKAQTISRRNLTNYSDHVPLLAEFEL